MNTETTNLNIRLDSNLKREADYLFKELGLTMSAAINIFLNQAVKSRSIPFEIKEHPHIPNRRTIKAIKQGEKLARDPNSKKYDNYDELFESLNS